MPRIMVVTLFPSEEINIYYTNANTKNIAVRRYKNESKNYGFEVPKEAISVSAIWIGNKRQLEEKLIKKAYEIRNRKK